MLIDKELVVYLLKGRVDGFDVFSLVNFVQDQTGVKHKIS